VKRESPPGNEERPGVGAEAIGVLAGGLNNSILKPGLAIAPILIENAIYGASPAKRRTNVQLDAIDDAILTVLAEEHPATLRGTFYRVMSAGFVEKSENGYRLVGRQVNKLRKSGALPQHWITDGTRYILHRDSFENLSEMLEGVASRYRRTVWANQSTDVQIFTEKDALTGVISSITDQWDVPLGVMRGYSSVSFAWSVATALPRDKSTFIYQLGDHDPSGVDAWRDFSKKVREFAPDADVQFIRLAVLPEQITMWNLPTRPTKQTDSRAKSFIGGSVEVDAISPTVLRSIVDQAIQRHIDLPAYQLMLAAQKHDRVMLYRMIEAGEEG
jgi:hypothetical protein